jgi:hypothetical protein
MPHSSGCSLRTLRALFTGLKTSLFRVKMKNLSRGGMVVMAVSVVSSVPAHAVSGKEKDAIKEVLAESYLVPAGLVAMADGGFDIPLSLDMFESSAAVTDLDTQIDRMVVTKNSVAATEVVDPEDEITVKVADLEKLLPDGKIAVLKSSAPPTDESEDEANAESEASQAAPEVVIISETVETVGETSPTPADTVNDETESAPEAMTDATPATADAAEPVNEAVDEMQSTAETAIEPVEEAVEEVASQAAPPAEPETTAKPQVSESDDESSAIDSLVQAIKPEAPIEPLENRRLTAYMSEKVLFTQVEQGITEGKFENSRVHLATLYSEERDIVLQGGISLDSTWSKTVRLSFGARAYVALLGQENEDTFAAAVGTEAAYRLPFKSAPLEFTASLYYAPDIMTFGVGDRALDAKLQLAIPFRTHSAIFTGIRYFQVDTQPEDREVDNRLHVGFRWNFE